jgi:F0F1-type ATP synthase assembly protein I
MIGFLFLGFAAGVFNVFRVATGTSRAVGYMPRRKGVEDKVGEHED